MIYVWFDALTNYISALGFGDVYSSDFRRWWLEADRRVHVIGKGILRFHAVYWPAFLEAAAQPPPTRIQVHPYLTVEGKKLSKSLGGGFAPTELVAGYGADALRWWFARDVGEVADTDFTIERLMDRANEDLANALGNTANRIATLVHRNLQGHVDPQPAQPARVLAALTEDVQSALADFRLREAARLIVDAVTALNSDLTATEPWRLAKDPERREELASVLAAQVGAGRAIAAAAEPIVPDVSTRLRRQLGERDGDLPEPRPVFARLEVAEQRRS